MKKLALLLLLTSCATPTETLWPKFEVPFWQEAKKEDVATVVNHEWWKGFEDQTLNQLIEKAKAQSPDVKIAIARIKQARASEEGVYADQFPIFSVGADAERSKQSQTLTSRPITRQWGANYSTGFDSVWEVNPSKLEPALRAADAFAQESEANYNHALVTLFGDVAREYFEIRKIQKQIEVAENNVKSQQDVVGLTKALVDAGKVSGSDKAAAETLLATTKAGILPLKSDLAAHTYLLETLLGEKPGALKEVLAQPYAVTVKPEVEVASPASVLAQRPDVKAAEQHVKYTTSLEDVAFAAYYPSVSITGLLGFETGTASKILNGKSGVASLAGGVKLPIFDFGRIKADIKETNAETEEALALYEKTVLNALAEVETAINALHNEQQHYAELNKAFESSQLSYKLADERYRHCLLYTSDAADDM
jgi:NodT family efflux transporter outer membrane factor (OMF) lipoprotein